MTNDEKHDKLHRRISDVAEELLECKTEVGRELEAGNIKFDALNLKMTELETKIDSFIKRIEDFIVIIEAAEGFFKFLGYIGTIFKWIVSIVAPLIALYYFIKTGHWK